MKIHVPLCLLYSRLIIALVILVLTFLKLAESKIYVLCLMYMGIITDIFDGIIARKLNLSTQNFRVLDTVFDLLFYFSLLFFIFSSKSEVLVDNIKYISIIIGLEGLMYCTSLIRFRKLPSPHAILSKFWGLYLITEFTLLILNIKGNHFTIALLFGIFVHVDRLLIYLLLKRWEHDIATSYHAFLIRNGQSFKKNKWFNS